MTRIAERTDDQELTDDEERSDEQVCQECGGSIVRREPRAERVCEGCGLVVEADEIDRGPEWRSFDDEDQQRSRVGAPTTELLHDRGLTATVGWKDEDGYGQPITGQRRAKLQRLRRWDERFRTRDASERNLKQALGEIDRMASALGLPDPVEETAAVTYRRALEADLLPGRSIEGMASAALYAAARRASVPRSLDEFDVVSRVDRTEIQRTYRYLARELGLAIEPADPESYVDRFASDLAVSEEARRLAHEVLRDAKAEGLHSGKSPVGMAAAALYVAPKFTDESITQAAVSDATDVSEVTIRNRYQELLGIARSI